MGIFDAPELSPQTLARRRILGMGLKGLGIMASVAAVPAAGGLAYQAVTGKSPLTLLPATEEDLQRTVLTYMDGKKYSSPDFGRQVTGTDAEFVDLRNDQVYFVLPSDLKDKPQTLEKLSKNPSHVRNSRETGGRDRLDDLIAAQGFEIISFPLSDFIVDPNRKVVINYPRMPFETQGDLFYDVTVLELGGFLLNRTVFDGAMYANDGTARYAGKRLLPNLGSLVTKKGEPSLERLVSRLVGAEDSMEGKIAKLNVFVANAIPYDTFQAENDIRFRKRANETLMTEKAICDSKVILLASLLEQIGADYHILYLFEDDKGVGHTQIAVAGDFLKKNGLGIKIGGVDYAIAEATVRNFFVGATTLDSYNKPENIIYRQKPGTWGMGIWGSRIIRISDGLKLNWDRS